MPHVYSDTCHIDQSSKHAAYQWSDDRHPAPVVVRPATHCKTSKTARLVPRSAKVSGAAIGVRGEVTGVVTHRELRGPTPRFHAATTNYELNVTILPLHYQLMATFLGIIPGEVYPNGED